MLYVVRYNLKAGRHAEFRRWILASREGIAAADTDGWRYLGTYFTVRALGSFDAETHWELDDDTAPGAVHGDEAYQRLLGEWLGFIDGHIEAGLMVSAEDLDLLAKT